MESKTSKSRLIIILAHVLVWVVFGIGVFFYHPLFSDVEISREAWVRQTATLVLLAIAFYVNVLVLVPRLLLKHQLAYYVVMVIALVGAVVLLNRWAEDSVHSHSLLGWQLVRGQGFIRAPAAPRLRLDGRRPIDRGTILICCLVVGIGTSITVIQKWQKDSQRREELEKDKVSSELSLLKAQINPHFFFNTLNNIYALTQVDATEAGRATHQLSRMMRYLLYETRQGQTMLSREVAFVKDYIGLMQLRLTDATKVCFEAPVPLADMPMAPMLLLPFVENAFKHGVSATQPSYVHIAIVQRGTVLDVTIKNSLLMDNSVSLDTDSGIGLVNTRRRLDLLYPEKYRLDIRELGEGTEYFVNLILELT
ncbi:MAG TPA: sensor histidine kinase [Puia sp.]|nr:sensor histidine kinase [Puia sp.]